MTGVTLVRFDGTVVPWGDRDDDDDEDLWRMGSPPPPDDESESESGDDAQSRSDVERQPMNGYEMRGYSYDDATRDALALYYVPANSNGLTARLDDKATGRRDVEMTADIRHEAEKLLEVPRQDAAGRRRRSACSGALGNGARVRAADHVQVHGKTRKHALVQFKKADKWRIEV